MIKHKQKKVHSKNTGTLHQSSQHANFIKRIGAYLIDLLTLSLILVIATFFAVLIVVICDTIGVIDVGVYTDLDKYLAQNLLFAGYLAIVTVAFYGYFWTKKGQTMGMKIFNLRVQNADGSNINFTQSLIRMATSAFGLGNFFALLYPYNAFQDTWTECQVIVLKKN
jgi:uncharacterized RDD family membrane protein YckC